MVMNNNFKIDRLVEEIASKSKIKSFYPIGISKALNLPLNIVIKRLNYLVAGEILSLKYEVRCTEDLTQLDLVDSYENVLGNYVNCYMCNDEKLITLDNIFIVYYINNDYIKSVKKKSQYTTEVNSPIYIENTPYNLPSVIESIVSNNDSNFFENINSIDSNLAIIAEKLANSGDKDIKYRFKEIDEDIKRNSFSKILKGVSESAVKVKEKVELIQFYKPIIESGFDLAIEKWPEISKFLEGLFNRN